MPDRLFRLPPSNVNLALAALAALLTGLIYYLLWRIFPQFYTDYTAGSFPSLIHALSLTWLSFALCGKRRGLILSSLVLILSLAAEQSIGFASTLDILMLMAGYAFGTATAISYLQDKPAGQVNTAVAGALLVSLSSVFIAGSVGCLYCGIDSTNARPVYMDYQTLRRAVNVSTPRPLTDTSRVYVYQSFVFLNNKNNGIHVIDNSDPTAPDNVAFIEIPGNTELSIRDNYLYADSYVDLVTLDISDPQNVAVVDRVEQIFPYDAYQNIPQDIYFGYDQVDETRGVVVSYVRQD